ALSPTSPFYLLDASEHGLAAEYLAWPSLRDIVVTFSSGMKTHKDRFAYAFTAKEMRDRLQEFVSSDVPGDLLRTEYGLKDTPIFLECVSSGFGERTAAPRQVFDYFYAVLYSPTYRSRYGGSLKSDFPRVPLPQQLELFRGVTRLGSELVSLHLMEAAKLNDF